MRGLRLAAVAVLALAGGAAQAAGWAEPESLRGACDRLVCRSVVMLKEQLLNGVHLGHGALRGAIEVSLDCARQMKECCGDRGVEGVQQPPPAP